MGVYRFLCPSLPVGITPCFSLTLPRPMKHDETRWLVKMKSAQIEAWILRIADRIKGGKPLEDSRVEIKAEWTDPIPAARRIAAHANAAGGEPILWIIGIDEVR